MRKTITRYLWLILLLLATVFLLQQIKWLPSFKDVFTSQPLEIDNTPLVIKEINALAQLITITAYNEVVIEQTIKGAPVFSGPLVPSIPGMRFPDKKIILIGKGKVLAGVDLAKLSDKNIFVKGDSVSVSLPKAVLLQVILNPSDFETFEETGVWSDDEVRLVKQKLKDKLIITVLRQNIIQKAGDKAKLIMENFLRDAGFKKVTVTVGS
ncbi:DUF4230 domain-containing protein [Ferruginibacter paludis]|uniref:DUF4230 domain-containing protein n=1 Tax=Ferruginibacter paludis TaxID=1310417 RepID=UPI0025B3131E|nr:DUF4230 domain-containing protein [Ferruginibacter paludis]MDN3654152.1 DUF4230 domain-containing protein [Ferruginibacter paludis]